MMTGSFTVTAVAEKVELQPAPVGPPGEPPGPAFTGQAAFTVTNTSSQPLRGRAVVSAVEPANPEWFSIAGEGEQTLVPNVTQQFAVRIEIPAGTPAGSYAFRLDAVAVERPDEDFTQGPGVTFAVPPSTGPRRFPWWIVAVVALLLVGGFIAFRVATGGEEPAIDETASPTTEPVPTTNPPLTPEIALDPPCGSPGTGVALEVSGSGFEPETRVSVIFFGGNVSAFGMPTTTADGDLEVTLFIQQLPNEPGTVTATETENPDVSAEQTFQVPC